MSLLRRPVLTCVLTAAASCPLVASAQVQNPGRVLGQEVRRVEANLVPPTPPVQGTVIQQGQPVAGTVVQSAPQPTTITPMTPTSTIGSHQIDRYEAIRQLQTDLRSDGNNLANWAILGELAHEVAVELPEGQDDAYYKLSREAYERAAQLDPTNAGLRAAVQFAREQEANSTTFDARRRQGVSTYLDARRREMATTGVNPTVMVYESNPTTITTTTTAPQPVAVTGQPYAPNYPTPTYRPYYNAQAQQPYGYNQYSNGYTPAPNGGTQTAAPTTLRQYGQQLPGLLLNSGVRTIGGSSVVPR